MDYLEYAKTAISDLNITADDNQVEQLAEYFEQGVENEIHPTDFVGVSRDKCKCEHYKGEVERLENIVRIYSGSVKDRRNCDKVWVDTSTDTVHYE